MPCRKKHFHSTFDSLFEQCESKEYKLKALKYTTLAGSSEMSGVVRFSRVEIVRWSTDLVGKDHASGYMHCKAVISHIVRIV